MRPSILVADDDAMLREFLQDLLEGEGFSVRCAADGIEAIAKASVDPPDLVLTDFLMPGLDGLGVIARLRERGLTMPVIVMSAHRRDMPAHVTFLPKPFDLHRLFAAMTIALPSMATFASLTVDDRLGPQSAS